METSQSVFFEKGEAVTYEVDVSVYHDAVVLKETTLVDKCEWGTVPGTRLRCSVFSSLSPIFYLLLHAIVGITETSTKTAALPKQKNSSLVIREEPRLLVQPGVEGIANSSLC